jgi:hypothetical protein
MLNIICNITGAEGKTARYTIKMVEESTVQNLIDRIQQRFSEPLANIQRNDGVQGPAQVLFFDENIDVGDEFWFNFERSNVSYFRKSRNFRRFRMNFLSL